MKKIKDKALKQANYDMFIKPIIQGIVGAIIFFIVFLLAELFLSKTPRIVFFINHGIFLPKPEAMTTIYHYPFREGEDFDIWTYDEKNFYKLISKKYFYKIDENNIETVRKIILDYYNDLDENEKSLFDKNVDINELIDINNYYFYKLSNDDNQIFIIIIADCFSKNAYMFNHVR